MALPSKEDLRSYLRIENDAEDGLLADLVESAIAHAESLINRPILATQRVYSGVRGIYDEYNRSVIYLPDYPVSLSPALSITDSNGDTVSTGDYAVSQSGRVTSVTGKTFSSHPYEITATTGLELDPDYATLYEPIVRSLILGIASIWYKQRDPNATDDSNLGVSWASNADTEGLPPHLYAIVRKLRPVRIR